MAWNGTDLRNEFSELLNDTSTEFKASVLGWINDVIFDISTRHNWPFYRTSARKILTTGTEEQDLYVSAPSAPSAAVSAGGSLTADNAYSVAVTFYNPTKKIETQLGTSVNATPTGANLTIDLTAIPTSSETSFFTQRRIYLRDVTGDGDWLLYSTITNNTATTASITAAASATAENPPDSHYINKLDGSPRIASISRVLRKVALPQLLVINSGNPVAGTPSYWAELSNDRIAFENQPSSALTLDFNIFRRPRRVYADITNEPDIPREFKELIKMGVKMKGAEYRERQDKEVLAAQYEQAIPEFIRKFGKYSNVSTSVRDVMGTTDGFVEV